MVVVTQGLPIGDVTSVLIFFFVSPPASIFTGCFCELKDVSGKAYPALDRILQRADRCHHRNDGEHTDGMPVIVRAAQFICAQRAQRHLQYFTEKHGENPKFAETNSNSKFKLLLQYGRWRRKSSLALGFPKKLSSG
jgi:hypothetical protein